MLKSISKRRRTAMNTSARQTRLTVLAAVALMIVALGSLPASATTMTFSSIRDVAILAGLPDNNFGVFPDVQTGTSVSNPTRSLISFDITTLGPQLTPLTVVDSVTMRLFLDAFDDASIKTTQVYAVSDANANWVEGTVNNVAEVGSSVWNQKQYTIANWAGSAGLSTAGVGLATPGIDYDSMLLASQTFTTGTAPASGSPVDFVFAGSSASLKALLDHWLNVANGGLFLRDPNDGTLPGAFDRIRYHSREAGNVLLQPQLIVEFHETAVPEPSMWVLIGLGAVGLVYARGQRRSALVHVSESR